DEPGIGIDTDDSTARVVADNAQRRSIRHERVEQVVTERRSLSLPVSEEDLNAAHTVGRDSGDSDVVPCAVAGVEHIEGAAPEEVAGGAAARGRLHDKQAPGLTAVPLRQPDDRGALGIGLDEAYEAMTRHELPLTAGQLRVGGR